jgi:colanic acid/amylovoran biosynthesis glycosyltransferase
MIKKRSYDLIHIRDYYPSKENPASSPWVYDIVNGMQKKGISSLIISPTPYIPGFVKKRNKNKYYLYPSPANKVESYNGTDVIRPLYFKIPNNIFVNINFYSLAHSITNAIPKNIQPKLIHAHFGQNGIGAVKLKQKYGVPLITSFYGYDSGRLAKKFKPHYKKLIQKGDVFLALSENMKSDLINLGFPEEKIIIHHLGIDLDIFKNIKEKIVKKPFVFLVVARIDESKGIQDVIQAFSKIYNKNMILKIVGDGAYKEKLSKLVSDLGINKNVMFINNFKANNPRGVVLEETQNCDVALLTSFTSENSAKEGTPVVLMEAQACGKPCIATFHAGIPEVVRDKSTGYLVRERDVDAISEYMILFYNNPNLVEKMGDSARNHIFANFNQSIQLKKLYSIYSKWGKFKN